MSDTIGPCEDCGLVDHHLVEGLCAECRAKYTQPEAPCPPLPEKL